MQNYEKQSKEANCSRCFKKEMREYIAVSTHYNLKIHFLETIIAYSCVKSTAK